MVGLWLPPACCSSNQEVPQSPHTECDHVSSRCRASESASDHVLQKKHRYGAAHLRRGDGGRVSLTRLGLASLVLAALSGQAGGVQCHVGSTVNTRVAEGLPVLKCNNTEEFIYSGCYSVCQEMRFSNGTGSDPFMIEICKFGCSTSLGCSQFERKKDGPFDVAMVCDCVWMQTGVYWTKALKGNVPFCCPDCWFGSVKTAMQCPSALGFTKSCCDGDGCNFSTGDRICPNARNTVIFSIALAAVLTYVSGLAR